DAWLKAKRAGNDRDTALAVLAGALPFVYVPRFYAPESDAQGFGAVRRLRSDVPEAIVPAVVADLDAAPLPTRPIVPYVECVQDRITLELMRGCPGRCRFCQSTTIKRPLRFRRVETLLAAAREAYRNTGYSEISLLSLSTSDYPQIAELVQSLYAEFGPMGVGISLPSLRVNEELTLVGDLLKTDRHSGLTIAPEAALDDMRRQLGKNISNDDLYAGCRRAMERGFSRVKLYFMCGLPGERDADLDGILEMADQVSRLGKETTGRWATVVANVSNFVPKPQTPFQWHAMQRREYFETAHERLRSRRRWKSVQVKCHDIESSLLEGVLSRGDRRMGEAVFRAWQAGARFDGWQERLRPELWWRAIREAGVDAHAVLHTPLGADARLPWDHIGIRQGRHHLERERDEARELLTSMCLAMDR
ncbi:MAG: radical SAM protein, partial [Planctomycetota bacterium]